MRSSVPRPWQRSLGSVRRTRSRGMIAAQLLAAHYGAYWYGDYGDPTDIVPDVQTPSANLPTPDSNVAPRRLGCSAQTYRVPSETGGETSVKVVHSACVVLQIRGE